MLIYLILTSVSKKWKGNLCEHEKKKVLEGLAESEPLAEDQHVFVPHWSFRLFK